LGEEALPENSVEVVAINIGRWMLTGLIALDEGFLDMSRYPYASRRIQTLMS
jgi:hypothetical protein